jgi:hypothetical protein
VPGTRRIRTTISTPCSDDDVRARIGNIGRSDVHPQGPAKTNGKVDSLLTSPHTAELTGAIDDFGAGAWVETWVRNRIDHP